VGYERLRQELIQGFCDGNSFAVLGGRRCGKTSMLIQIERDLNEGALSSFCAVPTRFSIQAMGQMTSGDLFGRIYDIVTLGIDASPWQKPGEGREYQDFLSQLDDASLKMAQEYGEDWVVVLLIDELDNALSLLPDDQFFQNLRHFLMESRLHRHFRIVASGVKEMGRLISSGSSPLNNLRHKYLGVLTGSQAQRLVDLGSDAGEYDLDSLGFLFNLTGKHPFLLQGVLEKMWMMKRKSGGSNEWDNRMLKRASQEFLKEHSDFQHWLNTFGEAEKAIYHCMATASEGRMHVCELRHKVSADLSHRIDEALTVLSYHGVIDDSEDPDEPKIAGAMFRDWFLRNAPKGVREERSPVSLNGEVAEATEGEKALRAKVREDKAGIIQNINISTYSEASPVIHQGLSMKDIKEMLSILDGLHNEISKLSIDERTKMMAKHALDEAVLELKEPECGGKPNNEKIRSSFEKAVSLLKSAGCAADTLRFFIDKAVKLGPYLGYAASWLSGLF
jgi:hypothetical protein